MAAENNIFHRRGSRFPHRGRRLWQLPDLMFAWPISAGTTQQRVSLASKFASAIENEDRRLAGFIERLSTGSQAPTRLRDHAPDESIPEHKTELPLSWCTACNSDGSVRGPNANPRRF
jgi:hypothetical protein